MRMKPHKYGYIGLHSSIEECRVNCSETLVLQLILERHATMSTSHRNHSGGKCNITREEIDGICKRFHVAPCHRQCFWRLADEGRIVSREFSRRLLGQRNYKRAYKALLTAMSDAYYQEMGIKFPPKDYQVPKDYQFA